MLSYITIANFFKKEKMKAFIRHTNTKSHRASRRQQQLSSSKTFFTESWTEAFHHTLVPKKWTKIILNLQRMGIGGAYDTVNQGEYNMEQKAPPLYPAKI